jgi:hypothetical protein
MIITHVGQYHIGQDIRKAKGVEEYDRESYADYEAAGAPRTYQTEQFFEGGYVDFAGVEGWTLTLATVNNLIYDFGLVRISVYKNMTNEAYKHTRDYLLRVMQSPQQNSSDPQEQWNGLVNGTVIQVIKNPGAVAV